MIRVLLSEEGWPVQHQWWWKFLDGTETKPTTPLTSEERVDIINLELLNWSAQLWQHRNEEVYPSHHRAYLDFYDEQAYHWFLLRWS